MPFPAIPAIIAGISGGTGAYLARMFVVSVAVDYVLKALVTLGFGIVSYNLGNWALDNLFDALKTNLSGAPAAALALVELGGFSECLSIVFGAMSVRMTMDGMKKSKFGFFPHLAGGSN